MTTADPFHPVAIATSRAHARRRPDSCASDDNSGTAACDCQPDPDDLADVWAGRARMAAARQAAGWITRRGPIDDNGNPTTRWTNQPLDTIDHQALAQQETTP